MLCLNFVAILDTTLPDISTFLIHLIKTNQRVAMATTDRTIVVVGAGPGIGRSVTSLFATKRYNKIALIARREEQLQLEKAAVEAAVSHPVTIKTYVVDVSDGAALLRSMDRIDAELGQPEVIFYNAARVLVSKFFEHPIEEIERDFKVGRAYPWQTRACEYERERRSS